MSFAFSIKCSGKKKHRVVVDLQQQKIHLPRHPPEVVQRYKALYDLGGAPVPCCAVLLDLEEHIYPGHLVIPSLCLSKALTEWQALFEEKCLGKFGGLRPIIIVPGDQAPELVGRETFHIGAARGQVIKNVQAFEAKGGRTICYPETFRYLVGEAFLVTNGLLDLPRPNESIETTPDPEWETATLT